MSIIITGRTGKSLREIIKELGNKSYDYIEFRSRWSDKYDEQYDEFWGACSYNSDTEELIPLDHDSYSLDDLYNEYEEWRKNDKLCLTIWERGQEEG